MCTSVSTTLLDLVSVIVYYHLIKNVLWIALLPYNFVGDVLRYRQQRIPDEGATHVSECSRIWK